MRGFAAAVAAVIAIFAIGAGSASADPGDGLAGLSLSLHSPAMAGTPFTVAVTAIDSDHDGDFSGTRCVTFSGPLAAPNGTTPVYGSKGTCTTGTSVSFVAHKATNVSITLFDAQTTTLKVTDNTTSVNASAAITVNPGSATHFAVSTPATTPTAGTPFTETVTALDTWGNIATGYAGTQPLVFGGPLPSPNNTGPSYPAPFVFAAGVWSGSITLFDAVQTVTLAVTQGSLTGSSNPFAVNPGQAASFSLAEPGQQTAGTPFDESLTALDTWGNVATGFTGAQALTFTGPANSPKGNVPSYPATGTFAAGVGIAHSIILFAAGTTSLTATQGTITGTTPTTFVVVPATLIPAFSAQPVDTQVSTPITSNALTKAAVAVSVADTYGNLAPDGTSVSMTGPAGLLGSTGSTTSGGVALFSTLSLGTIGGYQLTAQVGAATTLSNPFQIVVQLTVCAGSSCQANASSSSINSSASVSSGSGSPLDGLVLTTTFQGSNQPGGVCSGFSPIAGTAGNVVEVENTAGVSAAQPTFRITFTIPHATLKADGIGPIAALLTNVCLGAKRFDGLTDPAHAWFDLFGHRATYDAGTGLYWGLVPYWVPWLPSSNPYIAAKYFNSSGDLVIVLVKPYPWDGWAYV